MIFRKRQTQLEGTGRDNPLRRVFTIELSLASLLGVCLVVLIGVGWVFAFGVIVGRGFEPDKKMPVLGRLVPQTAETSPEKTGTIKPEDLTFFSDLKSQPALSTEPAPTPAAKPHEAKSADAKKQEKQTDPKKQDKAASSTQVPSAHADAKAPRYDFLFQVIAYKKSDQADAFREKLEGAGLRTRLHTEKDKQGNIRMYRVQVVIRGTDADADHVREVLIRNGVKNPAQPTRKPI